MYFDMHGTKCIVVKVQSLVVMVQSIVKSWYNVECSHGTKFSVVMVKNIV